jgi:hypothetical protein
VNSAKSAKQQRLDTRVKLGAIRSVEAPQKGPLSGNILFTKVTKDLREYGETRMEPRLMVPPSDETHGATTDIVRRRSVAAANTMAVLHDTPMTITIVHGQTRTVIGLMTD